MGSKPLNKCSYRISFQINQYKTSNNVIKMSTRSCPLAFFLPIQQISQLWNVTMADRDKLNWLIHRKWVLFEVTMIVLFTQCKADTPSCLRLTRLVPRAIEKESHIINLKYLLCKWARAIIGVRVSAIRKMSRSVSDKKAFNHQCLNSTKGHSQDCF